MKKIVLVLAAVLCSSLLMFAGESDKMSKNDSGKNMSGMVCDSKCVTMTEKKAACSKSCNETSGEMVFVDSKGHVMKIDNQDKVMGMAGKKVKVKGKMMGSDTMHVDEIAPVTY